MVERSYTMLVLVGSIMGLVIGALAAEPLTSYLRIQSSGSFNYTVRANSGSVEDVQIAVDKAIETGAEVVKIPKGNWTFAASGSYRVNIVVPSTGLKILGAGINQTILRLPADTSSAEMFKVNGESGGKFEFSNITLYGRPNYETSQTGDGGIWIESCQDFRIHHCNFHDLGSFGIWINDMGVQRGTGGDITKISQGLVDHCNFYRIWKPGAFAAQTGYGYGVTISRGSAYYDCPWDSDIWNILGKYYKNTFIEDCYFSICRHAVACSTGGVYVFRHNMVEHPPFTADAIMTGHPARSYSTGAWGMRAFEVYDNVFEVNNQERYHCILVAGGGGTIFNNTITDFLQVFIIGSADTADPSVCPEGCPHDLWIWDNTLINYSESVAIQTRECGTPVEWDGTGSEPDVWYALTEPWGGDYSPYEYPHPLQFQS